MKRLIIFFTLFPLVAIISIFSIIYVPSRTAERKLAKEKTQKSTVAETKNINKKNSKLQLLKKSA